jgi:hypothetical protein
MLKSLLTATMFIWGLPTLLFAQGLTLEQEINWAFQKQKIPLPEKVAPEAPFFWDQWQAQKRLRPEWGKSPLGRDLPYFFFPASPSELIKDIPERTILFIGGVHADEVSPLYSSFRLLQQLLLTGRSPFAGVNIVYLPLNNPDGFIDPLKRNKNPTRNNAKNIDLNRNFNATKPQPETRFVKNLIAEYRPEYIVSLHGPYCWLDYDGPIVRDDADPLEVREVDMWLSRIQARAIDTELPINKNFRTYPGSLGHYAGDILDIHTLTFEYQHKKASLAATEWHHFGKALFHSLDISHEHTRAWR